MVVYLSVVYFWISFYPQDLLCWFVYFVCVCVCVLPLAFVILARSPGANSLGEWEVYVGTELIRHKLAPATTMLLFVFLQLVCLKSIPRTGQTCDKKRFPTLQEPAQEIQPLHCGSSDLGEGFCSRPILRLRKHNS